MGAPENASKTQRTLRDVHSFLALVRGRVRMGFILTWNTWERVLLLIAALSPPVRCRYYFPVALDGDRYGYACS